MRIYSMVCSCAGGNGATAMLSDMAAKKITERAGAVGKSVEYERVTADTVSLNFCRSCNSCFTNGICPLDSVDDMGKIKEKLLSADVIFFCSPVYMGSMSGFAKSLIDRIAYFSHRFEFAGKTAVVLVTTSNNYGEETVKEMKKQIQFMGASVAYELCAYRHEGKPNIYLPGQMDIHLDGLAKNVMECLYAPEKYIEKWQELSFIRRNKMNKHVEKMSEIMGTELPDETRVCSMRGHENYKTLTDYVLSIKNGVSE